MGESGPGSIETNPSLSEPQRVGRIVRSAMPTEDSTVQPERSLRQQLKERLIHVLNKLPGRGTKQSEQQPQTSEPVTIYDTRQATEAEYKAMQAEEVEKARNWRAGDPPRNELERQINKNHREVQLGLAAGTDSSHTTYPIDRKWHPPQPPAPETTNKP